MKFYYEGFPSRTTQSYLLSKTYPEIPYLSFWKPEYQTLPKALDTSRATTAKKSGVVQEQALTNLVYVCTHDILEIINLTNCHILFIF